MVEPKPTESDIKENRMSKSITITLVIMSGRPYHYKEAAKLR